jgi:hypothetical protein
MRKTDEEQWDTGLNDDKWLPVGTAASLVSVDPRTMRRWVDKGLVLARVTPEGRRQVSKASLRTVFERETIGRRTSEVSMDAGRSAPEVVIPYLAAAMKSWGTWKPGLHLTTAKRVELLGQVQALVKALDAIDGVLAGEIFDRENAEEEVL